MLLNPTDVNTRAFEHNLRAETVNRTGWLVPASHRRSHLNTLAILLRAITMRLAGSRSSAGSGTPVRKEGARSLA